MKKQGPLVNREILYATLSGPKKSQDYSIYDESGLSTSTKMDQYLPIATKDPPKSLPGTINISHRKIISKSSNVYLRTK